MGFYLNIMKSVLEIDISLITEEVLHHGFLFILKNCLNMVLNSKTLSKLRKHFQDFFHPCIIQLLLVLLYLLFFDIFFLTEFYIHWVSDYYQLQNQDYFPSTAFFSDKTLCNPNFFVSAFENWKQNFLSSYFTYFHLTWS